MASDAVGALTARTPDLTRRVSSALLMHPLHHDLSSSPPSLCYNTCSLPLMYLTGLLPAAPGLT